MTEVPEIPWHSPSTQASWQALLDHFGYVVVELHQRVNVPFYFRRAGWECTLKIISESTYDELMSQRNYEGTYAPYLIDSGNFYRLVVE